MQVGGVAQEVIRRQPAQPRQLPARVLMNVHDVDGAGLDQARQLGGPVGWGDLFRAALPPPFARGGFDVPDGGQGAAGVDPGPLQVAQVKGQPPLVRDVGPIDLDRHAAGSRRLVFARENGVRRQGVGVEVREAFLKRPARQQGEAAKVLHRGEVFGDKTRGRQPFAVIGYVAEAMAEQKAGLGQLEPFHFGGRKPLAAAQVRGRPSTYGRPRPSPPPRRCSG